MTKKKWIILIVILMIILFGVCFLYWDKTRCHKIQRRCTMYDLSEIENVEDIEFYRGLNEKCAGRCGTAKIKLDIEKWWCRYQYKKHVEETKDRRYFQADAYNPCPELYTLPELNVWLRDKD